ncbi:MAG: trypsin-like peptidase domain-containing protein, partial [Zavarzinia sp.]|nr:trypsin-like peptidase domain-containing protein [Zavarzinia sp.]
MAAVAVLVATVSATPSQAEDTRAVPESQSQVLLSFAPVVKASIPAVVNIYTKKRVAVRNPMMDDPFFRRFFGDQMQGMPRERVEQSLGSGVIVGADGTIVTNNHVIEGADEITVALSDGREFEAKLQIADPRTDLAVLKLDSGGETLPTLSMADSEAVEVGDIVLAIGNPFGVGQTVTQGIVSAVARTKVGVSDYRFFIQTDAAINPGNSGGALIDLKGRLVGINSSIYSRDGGSLGIGFAIPSSMVRSVVAAARSGGRIVRPWLGATGQPVTSDLAAGLGLDRPRGVLVNGVAADGPAAKGGVKVGDVILSVDDHPVGDP